ncbi:MAG: hypothetical protein V3R37_05550 [Rhodospirillales bacterium]
MIRSDLSIQTIFAVTAVIGFLNAVARPVAVTIEKEGALSALLSGLGMNPILAASFVLAIILVLHSAPRPVRQHHFVLALAVSVGLFIPSATVAWLMLGALAAAILLDKSLPENMRAGGAIMMAVAMRDPLSRALLDLFAEPLLAFDGRVAAIWLSTFYDQVGHRGNLIIGPDGHRLLILTGCSSFANLSYSLLAWFAVSRAFLSSFTRRVWIAGAGISVLVPVLNHLRLARMGLDAEAYVFFHSGEGRYWFEAGIVLITCTLILWGTRHANAQCPADADHRHSGAA